MERKGLIEGEVLKFSKTGAVHHSLITVIKIIFSTNNSDILAKVRHQHARGVGKINCII